jgi:hypothetical protein
VSPLEGVNGARRDLLARIGLSVACRVSGARGRSDSAALSLSTHNSPLTIRRAFGLSKGRYSSRALRRQGHTFGDGGGNRFIEQSTRKKIEIIGENAIVAGTGSVGHMQRFAAVTQKLWNDKSFSGKSDLEIGKLLSSGGIADFNQTHAMNRLDFAAMVT